jgi:Protein of unknown function (DUF2637)
MTNDQSPARASHLAGAQRALRFLALAAVIIGVLGLAAAAFDLSYPGIHAIALTAGVSPTLSRLYPPIFDAMLVVASAAILSLRGAGVLTRCYAWLSLLLLLCAAAGADALHATGTRLPHRAAAATVAIIPWALVLLGFGLLLAMLRHARLRRAQAAQARADAAPPAGAPAAVIPVAEVQAPEKQPQHGRQADLANRQADPAAGRNAGRDAAAAATDSLLLGDNVAPVAAPATSSWPGTDGPGQSGEQADSHAPELALDAEPGHDDPTSDEAHSAGHPQALWVPRAREAGQPAPDRENAAENPAPIMSPAPTAEVVPARHAGPGLNLDPGAELTPDSVPELASGPGTELDRGGNAERAPETEPDLGGEPGTEGEPEPGMAPVAPFERMWSSPTPPDV